VNAVLTVVVPSLDELVKPLDEAPVYMAFNACRQPLILLSPSPAATLIGQFDVHLRVITDLRRTLLLIGIITMPGIDPVALFTASKADLKYQQLHDGCVV